MMAFMRGVERFNRDIIAAEPPDRPGVLSGEALEHAHDCLVEEVGEFDAASRAGRTVDAADALVDLAYFALGRLVAMGVRPEPVVDEVQRANMLKERGWVDKRPNSGGGDAVKPPGWTPPDHSWIDQLSPSLVSILRLRAAKHRDYQAAGSRVSIDDYFPFGLPSYAQMCHVKCMRLVSLIASDVSPVHESVRDTFVDLVNYATFAVERIDRDAGLGGAWGPQP